MGRKIGRETRSELIDVLRQRYRESSKEGKSRVLDEFVAVSGYHRKHAIRVLGGQSTGDVSVGADAGDARACRRIYGDAVREALVVLWEASDRICGKRLKAIMPGLVEAMERHGHLQLDPEVRRRLMEASSATIDRLLGVARGGVNSRRRKRRRPTVSAVVPVRTFGDWHEPGPGYIEIDLVAHCGGAMTGSFIHTLVATDICSEWIECVPLLVREQSLVVQALDAICRQVPFPLLGIDSDNDSAFMNETLIGFCRERNLVLTRSRPHHKNDQAWVEQKNGAVVRRMTGYERFSGIVAGQALAHLYQAGRLYVNFFQPSFKLREKVRDGAKVRRTYYVPRTPCDRLLQHPGVDEKTKEALRHQRLELDPAGLLHLIRESQAALAALVSPGASVEGPGRQTLDQFLAQLPRLWQEGEVRPTHRCPSQQPRHWRTRQDPFEAVWCDVLGWMENDPDATGKALFRRLQTDHPNEFPDGQLRTFQRRIHQWRQIMARKLVYPCVGTKETSTTEVPGAAI